MGYVTKEYFDKTFHGTSMSDAQFERMAMIASDVIDAVILQPITALTDAEQLAKAASYQIEYLLAQGGIDAINGASANQFAVTEKLDDYTITEGLSDSAEKNKLSINGIPLSPLTISILKKLGLMHRWVYAGRCRRGI